MDSGDKSLEARAAAEWSRLAGEAITVEVIRDTLYAFGSELATLRLFKRFCKCEGADAGYSANLKTHYFSLPRRWS